VSPATFFRAWSPRSSKSDADLSLHLAIDIVRHADAADLCDALEALGQDHAFPEDVAAVDDDFAEVEADAEPDLALVRRFGVAADHRVLNVDGAGQRLHCADEFREHAVAGGLEDAPAMPRDLRLDQFLQATLYQIERADLILAHMPRVALDVGEEDCGESTLDRRRIVAPALFRSRAFFRIRHCPNPCDGGRPIYRPDGRGRPRHHRAMGGSFKAYWPARRRPWASDTHWRDRAMPAECARSAPAGFDASLGDHCGGRGCGSGDVRGQGPGTPGMRKRRIVGMALATRAGHLG
jgi:hypothetical protein